jgi:hypothetical protein
MIPSQKKTKRRWSCSGGGALMPTMYDKPRNKLARNLIIGGFRKIPCSCPRSRHRPGYGNAILMSRLDEMIHFVAHGGGRLMPRNSEFLKPS